MNFLIQKRKEESNKNLKEKLLKYRKKFRDSKIKEQLKDMPLNMNKYLANLYTGGVIKKYPEDFVVEEIMLDGTILEVGKSIEFKDEEDWKGTFIHFTLEKKNWTTLDAIREIANRVGKQRKHFGFAGNKDKYAITTQRVGCFNVKLEDLKKIKIKGIILRDFQKTNRKIRLGDLWGNRFTVRVGDPILKGEDLKKVVNDLCRLKYFINYYGIQRFGTTRPITHIVGKFIVERDWESAFHLYCGTPLPYDDERSKLARSLVDEENFKEAYKRFPKVFFYERRMIKRYLETGNYQKAFMILPPHLRCMFVNAYQSYLFNEIVNMRSDYGFLPLEGDVLIDGLPSGALFGYKTNFASGIQGEIEREVYEREYLSPEKFKIGEFGSFVGGRRTMIERIYNLSYCIEDNSYVLKFCLKKGNYATSVLREFLDRKD
ncbi:tRNA pseudouridine synthase D TruD [Methanocaldococcus vulcanius M7]|uniref:Probable tRNA pseudouridine synthase D n=1 Tax=Methanocaldococcus vulcanius (strain ATCC 700851 / DSM 12094 / M7) TaxID=579137 RepID=C9RHW7_METVM|nr:tRNA pseudouridine(13) synthase TruD [Methanocaldococcus vulcanius]ACX73169.1 tRNA pseudouridine synthase D TruD [Methanocaldococcus vulcanius M7]